MIIPGNVSASFKCQYELRVDGNTEEAFLNAKACILAKMRDALGHKLDNVTLELESVVNRLQELSKEPV